MSYAELRQECERLGIGPLLWALLVEVCKRISRKYPPNVYSDDESWSEESIRDLAQEVTLERLLGEHQLEYVLRLAQDEDSLARLLAFQVRRVLSHRRALTVVDRLVSRVRTLTQSDDYETSKLGLDLAIRLPGSTMAPRFLSETELRRGSQIVHSIPRLPSNPNAERESKVYKAADLTELVRLLLDEFDGIMLGDIRKILEVLLTAWLPTILQESEESQVSPSGPELEIERSQMTELIKSLVKDIGPAHRSVLLGKSQGSSDGELATRLGRSRPWLADRKTEVLSLVETRLISSLPEQLHAEATRMLLDELESIEEGST